MLKGEACASNTEQRSNKASDAALKNAPILPSKEEYASSTEQRSSYAALKDAQINPNEEEYAGDTVHAVILTMNQPLSHRVLGQSLIRLH